jgi:phospholipid/cholesterol/gamma-HCH transport system ATP-binding protein
MEATTANPSAALKKNGTANPSIEIRIQGLCKSFGEHLVLKEIDLEICRGELVAIVGGSGCGKTVLMKHMIGQLQPDRGKVFIADHETAGGRLVDLSTLSEAEMDHLRRHWAVVFQKNALYGGTVFENISLALIDVQGMDESVARRRAAEVLRAVALDPDIVLDRRRDELSGGMAKRVALARALVLDPMLMFYDEPTTGLDPVHAEQIHDLIKEVHNRPAGDGGLRTTIIVTHDAQLLFRLKPRVIMLYGGGVLFDGSALEFESSTSPVIKPYLDFMPFLHRRAQVDEPAA